MKKKLKDVTIDKLYEYCEKKETCDDCPFGYFQYCKLNTPWMPYEGILEQEIEIEIPEEEFGNSEQLEEENGKEKNQRHNNRRN